MNVIANKTKQQLFHEQYKVTMLVSDGKKITK